MFLNFADAPHTAHALRQAMELFRKERRPAAMPEADLLPDHMGVAGDQLPVTSRDAIFAAEEADRGILCKQSGKPIEITRASALEHYDANVSNCQLCQRCR